MRPASADDDREYRRNGEGSGTEMVTDAAIERGKERGRQPRVLVFTTVFPSPIRPLHGVFVAERLKRLARHAEVRVVAPVPRWPWRRHAVRRRVELEGLAVLHPTFHYIRGIFKSLDGVFLFLSSLAAVIETRRDFNFDLIDAHFAYPDGFAALLLGWWFRRPVIITERGTLPSFRRGSLRRRLADWGLRRADRVIVVARPLADLAIAAGASPNRVVVIENGVDTERFAPRDRTEARQRLGVTQSIRLLVSVGHLSKRKGFQRVISVLPRLLGEVPDLRLAIVGGPGAEGNNRSRLERLVADLDLRDRVIFVGARPPNEVATWLNAADVFVLASDHEGSPNAVWEALASGRPVVASRVGDVDHMVPRFAGIVYDDPYDLDQLAFSLATALRSHWSEKRIRAHGEAHGWDSVARRVLVEWDALIESDCRRRAKY